MPVRIKHHGNFNNTNKFLEKMSKLEIRQLLDAAGRVGVDALSAQTPKDTGATGSMWGYEVVSNGDSYSIHWTDDHVVDGFSVVIGLQYGHGTGTGGYVVGRDFINPAIRPIFDLIAENVWREVTSA